MGILSLKIALALLLLWATASLIRMRIRIERGKRVAATAVAFERNIPHATTRILIAGDSTAVGVGAARPEESVAGRFGTENPNAEIINISRSGKRIHELREELNRLPAQKFTLVVLMIGGNDIVHLTDLRLVEADLTALLTMAKKMSPVVLVVHSGNIGAAPLFPWPVGLFYTSRTRKIRAIYIQKTQELGAIYVDLFKERHDDIFLSNPEKYYLPDRFHPSSDGYAVWYSAIKQALASAGPTPGIQR